jgi:hypothetical protein
MSKKSEQKKRGIQSRTALSVRNIVEFSMSECAKVVHRNKCSQSSVLKTDPKLFQTIVYVPPAKTCE